MQNRIFPLYVNPIEKKSLFSGFWIYPINQITKDAYGTAKEKQDDLAKSTKAVQ